MKPLPLLAACVALPAIAQDSAVQLQPGQWQITTRMTEVKMPGVSEEIAAEARTRILDDAKTQSRCITPEEAANPTANLANPGGSAQGCTFSRQVFAGGVIDIAGICPSPTPDSRLEVALSGTYTARGMSAVITANVQGGSLPMRMRGTLQGSRTGDCESN